MPYTMFGLPSHILLVHLAVVGIPTSSFAVIAIAARAKWRRKWGPLVAAFAIVMVPITYATQLAGQQFFNHQPGLRQTVAQHQSLGQTLVWFVGAMAVAAVLLVAADRANYADNHAVMVTLAGLAIATSAICVVQTIRVGDSGARATWGGYTGTPAGNSRP